MKHALLLPVLLIWSHWVIASDSAIAFRSINHADLFEVAEKENKGVMLYFHFDGCGACVLMERTAFIDENVADIINANFVSYDINTRKGDGIEINQIYNIQLHPSFIFFDNTGKEIHRLVGLFSPEDFYDQVNDLLHSNKSLTNYKGKYKAGKREPDFLFEYTYMLRDAYELDSIVVNDYLNVLDESDYSLEKNIKYIYEFCIHNFKIFMPFNNPGFDFLLNNKTLFYQYFDSSQVRTRIVWILYFSIYNAVEQNDEKTFKEALAMLELFDTGETFYFQEMDGRTTGVLYGKSLVLSSLLNYYKKIDDQTNYKKTEEKYIAALWDDPIALNNYAWSVFEHADDDQIEKIQTAIECSVRSIELSDNYANNDTYAWLLYRLGDIENAYSRAIRAIEIAKSNNQDFSETQKLIDIILSEKEE